ncbi:hypothetical protein JTE90_012052 [Oedothorax gibbosus]|uniref:Uncharacterized protein n=1 Tax=Oedothorax gibbosus TaxID=931172 RepID=A0AAV6TDS0_9ARAC|nr:hypothetical protein JTE90_012052 [Oedothorax gibbosus]
MSQPAPCQSVTRHLRHARFAAGCSSVFLAPGVGGSGRVALVVAVCSTTVRAIFVVSPSLRRVRRVRARRRPSRRRASASTVPADVRVERTYTA